MLPYKTKIMNKEIFYYGLLELGISILLGVIVLYISYRVVDKLIRKKYNIEINNTAYAIFCSSVLFSVAYLISGVKAPILNSVRMIQDQVNYDGIILLDGLKYTGIFLAIILIVITIVNLLSILLYTLMTRNINEFEEIKKWLTSKVHMHGKRYTSLDEMLVAQVGEPLTTKYFIENLTQKYTELYKIE